MVGAAALILRTILIKKRSVKSSPVELRDEMIEKDIQDGPILNESFLRRVVNDSANRQTAVDIDWEELSDGYRPQPLRTSEFYSTYSIEPNLNLKKSEPIILVRNSVFEEILNHLKSDTSVEKGGLLIGKAYDDAHESRYMLQITHQFEANAGLETSATFTYTPSTWEQLLPQIKSLSPDTTILGSYHSHPDMGVFLSITDMEAQTEIFNADWQVAMVVDPVRNEAGFFIGMEGTKCENWQIWDDKLH